MPASFYDWAVQTRGTSSSQGLGITYDGAGGALVTGYFIGEASFGSTSLTSRGEYDAFVMHVTASGAPSTGPPKRAARLLIAATALHTMVREVLS